ncbi:hypothetical protein Tco_1039369 [Tanacetum coccineum]
MYHNLNQLQWQLERSNFYGHDCKTCLVVLRRQFKEFLDSKEVNASDVPNKCWQKNFSDGAQFKPEAYRRSLLRYLDELDTLIDERVLKYGETLMKEKEVQAIKEIEKRLKESEMQKQESLVTEGAVIEDCMVTDAAELEACLIMQGAAIEACLVTEGATLEACLVNEGIAVNDNTSVTESSGTKSENSSSATPFSRSEDENRSSDKESSSSGGNHADADIGSSNDSDSVLGVYHDLFKNMFAHGIQNHKQPKSIPDTYVVNENNSNINSDIPNMDPDINKEEYDYVNYEQQHAFFASFINNLQCNVKNIMRLIVKLNKRMPY